MVAFWGTQKWPASDVSTPWTQINRMQGELPSMLAFWFTKPKEAQLLRLPSCVLTGLYLSNIKVTSVPFIFSGLKIAIRTTFWNLPPRRHLWHLTFSVAVCSLWSFGWGEGQGSVWPTGRYAVVPKSQGDWYCAPQLGVREQMLQIPRTWAKRLLKADRWAAPWCPVNLHPATHQGHHSLRPHAPKPKEPALQGHVMFYCTAEPAWLFPSWFKINLNIHVSFLLRGEKMLVGR